MRKIQVEMKRMKCVSHHITSLSLNGYSSPANPNPNRKRRNQRFISGPYSFPSKSFVYDNPTPAPLIPYLSQ